MSGTRTTDRLVTTLEIVRAAGETLQPAWDPADSDGFRYLPNASELDEAEFRECLAQLARQDYLERIFVDRLSECPTCHSHALNVREVCLQCKSPNLSPVETIHHFRCGYVGEASTFALEPAGRRCPKCFKLLEDLGTDHESPGAYFMCNVCGAKFPMPDVGALCLSCGNRFNADEMLRIGHRDVFAYKLTALGRAALKEGRLLEGEREAQFDAHASIYRRSAMLDLIEDERRLRKLHGTPFSLIVLATDNDAAPGGGEEPGGIYLDGADETYYEPEEDDGGLDAALAGSILETVGESHKLGRLDQRHLLLLLRSTPAAKAKSTLRRIMRSRAPEVRAVHLSGTVVDLPDSADLDLLLAAAVRELAPR